jgi:hypothetical protein
MYYRRGFFRLWIVLSVIWVAIISAISAESILKPWSMGTDPPKLERLERALENARKAGATEDVNTMINARIEMIFDHAEQRELAFDQSANALKGLALGGLLPPLILLAIGSGLFWALSGFTRE